MTDLMCTPPTSKFNKAETVEKYESEKSALFNSLKKRAEIVSDSLNKMENISCNEVEGAMYAFPRIKFSQKVLDAAKKRNMEPDMFYCLSVLENTGIVMVPGSGFRQRENTHHFRITTLIMPEDRLTNAMNNLKEYNSHFHAEYKWKEFYVFFLDSFLFYINYKFYVKKYLL